VRTDIKHHSLFNPFMTHAEAEPEAKRMKLYIENGKPVYIASLSFPERLVLDQLYVLLDTEKNLIDVSSLSTEELVHTFPQYGFQKIVLMENEQIWIYRVVPRGTTHMIAALPSPSRVEWGVDKTSSHTRLDRGGMP
jgi:hypothetical protein